MAKLILVVEDIEILRTAAVLALQSFGHLAASAENGFVAFTMLRAARFDLVLMDIQMPIMTGIEAVARIRADPDATTARTPIIAYSSDQIVDKEGFCAEHGFDGYIDKSQGLAAMYFHVDAFFAKSIPS